MDKLTEVPQTSYQFFVAVRNGVRMPVRTNPLAAKADANALGKGAQVKPIHAAQAAGMLVIDAQMRFAA